MKILSIIIPAYNAEKYIEETMLSVIAQKYNDFEYIIKDGGSSDDTNNIVQDVKKRYDKLIEQVILKIYMKKNIKT